MTKLVDKSPAKGKPENDEERWLLKLYVAGATPNSTAAFASLKKTCEERLNKKYVIEVIDIKVNPKLAHDDQIVAIPTLIRELPEPIRKIIGDLSNTDKILMGLQMQSIADRSKV